MAFFGKGKKEDLRILCDELGLTATEEMKMIDLRNLITTHDDYEEDYTKNLLTTIVENRKAEQQRLDLENQRVFEQEQRKIEQENLERERTFELEKLRLTHSTSASNPELENNRCTYEKPRIDLQKLIPRFRPNEDDMNIFLVLCERQLKVLGVPEENWVTYLISALPSDIARLIAREPEEKAQDYQHIKAMLLKRFKLTAEKFRILFVQHKKIPESTWKDYFFELRTYFEGWLSELNITSFEDLKNLILSDKLKRRCSPQHREHFLDVWTDLNDPDVLVEKLDAYDVLRVNPVKSNEKETHQKNKNWSKQKETVSSSFSNKTVPNEPFFSKKTTPSDNGKVNPSPLIEDRPTLKCYGCGAPGFIRAKCPTCNPVIKTESSQFEQIQIYTCSTTTTPLTTVNLKINGVYGTACVDTGSSHSLASESLYSVLKEKGAKFQRTSLNMSLANGQRSHEDSLTTTVTVEIEGRQFRTNFIVLPKAKENRTLLGRDFLDKSGFVPDVKNKRWYFGDMPHIKYGFADLVPKPFECSGQKSELNYLPKGYDTIFQPGGGATPRSCEIGTVSIEINPKPNKFAKFTKQVKDLVEQRKRKQYVDRRRIEGSQYSPGDHVWVEPHPVSKAGQKRTAKFSPRRDGPYVVLTQRSPTSYEVASLQAPEVPLGTYHTSALKRCNNVTDQPVSPLRKRGRPKKNVPGPLPRRLRNQRGRM